jgi:ribosome-associated heat shock protein Hsp15
VHSGPIVILRLWLRHAPPWQQLLIGVASIAAGVSLIAVVGQLAGLPLVAFGALSAAPVLRELRGGARARRSDSPAGRVAAMQRDDRSVDSAAGGDAGPMRIDRWLWTARLFKTRALAAGAVRGGRVHVNGVAAKPSREVATGDELQITLGPVRRTVIVRGAAERRVSAAQAAGLYDETAESVAERERQAQLRRLAGPVDVGGRPTKRDRRRYDARRG